MSVNARSFFWKYAVREIRRRPLRCFLTLVGIVIGVAAVTAVGLGSAATREAYTKMLNPILGATDLEVLPPSKQGRMTVRMEVFDTIAGIKAAVPLLQVSTGLVTPTGPVGLVCLGIDPARDEAVRTREIQEGEDLSNQKGLLLETGFAQRHGLQVGKMAKLMTPTGPTEVEIVGLLRPSGTAQFHRGAIALLPLPFAQSLFQCPGEVTAVHIAVADPANVSEVQGKVAQVFPTFEVQPPTRTGQLAADFLLSIDQGLSSMSAVAVVGGGLVILNTFLMSLGERQRQMALLRALGATQSQVIGLLLRQAMLLGIAGTILGLPVGILLAYWVLRINEWFLHVPLPTLSITPKWILLAGLIGPIMALLAMVYPARCTAQQTPLMGIRPLIKPDEDRPRRWPQILGVGLLLFVVLFEILIVSRSLSSRVATDLLPFLVACCLVGCACLIPWMLPGLLILIRGIITKIMGMEGLLAVRQLQRHPSRTGLTVAVIFTALCAGISFGTSFLNNMRDINLWFDHTIDAAYLIRAIQPDPALTVYAADLPRGVEEELKQWPEISHVGPIRFITSEVNKESVLILARDFPREKPLQFILHEGNPDGVFQGLHRGEAAISSTLAGRLRVQVGDTLSIPTRQGLKQIRVAGIIKEYSAGGMTLYLEWNHAAKWFAFDRPHALAIIPVNDKNDRLNSRLQEWCQNKGLLLQPKKEFGAMIYRVAVAVRGMLMGLAALIFAVAGVGIANTLTTNILDMTRELGLLRALGMKRGQLVRLIFAQTSGLLLLGCLTGIPGGLLLAWLMNRATPGLLGHQPEFAVEWWLIGLCVLSVGVVSLAATLLPARRAAHLPLLEALRYE